MQYYGTGEMVEVNAEYNETCGKSVFSQADTPLEVYQNLINLALKNDAKLTNVRILPLL